MSKQQSVYLACTRTFAIGCIEKPRIRDVLILEGDNAYIDV